MDRDDDGSSQWSGATGSENRSDTSGQRSNAKFLGKKRGVSDHADAQDLLEQKRSIEDGIFSCMYTLVHSSALTSWKFACIKISLEFLMFFLVSFNPEYPTWTIDVSSPLWQVLRWSLWRSPIIRLYGYKTYVVVLYVMAVAVFAAVGGLVVLTHAMRRRGAEVSRRLHTAAAYLHILYDIMFFTCYASFFDYFIFAANCDYTGGVKQHMYFKGVMCFEMPHLLHLCVALSAAALFLAVTACLTVAAADLNPLGRAALASPSVTPRLKILGAKAVFVTAAGVLDGWPRTQAGLNVVCVGLVCWWNLKELPFYRRVVNAMWFGLWSGIFFTTVLHCVMAFGSRTDEGYLRQFTQYVLYGIFPVVIGGGALCGAYAWIATRPAARFRSGERDAKPSAKPPYRFPGGPPEVQLLARCVRTGLCQDGPAAAESDRGGGECDYVVEDAALWGESVIKAGLAAFPASPSLLILYANFLLAVRRDGPAARTQLQLAAKHGPSVVERYQVFCTLEASKRLKGNQANGSMGLQSYIEFRRNYRAVCRAHKAALSEQVALWRLLLQPRLRVRRLDAALGELEAAADQAHQVYKRVLERYPSNGKLLRCYGKFLEDVWHDSAAAARAYGEANRNGGAGSGSGWGLSLDLTALQTGAEGGGERPEVFGSLSGEDAIVVINAEGTIMMVSQAVQSLFGYTRPELEGSDVRLLMPPPFCSRHAAYMQRYVAGGEAHLLDSVREVVGLHKERYVFPLSLCVTRLSGTGSDSVFLGLLRPIPPGLSTMRVWLAPNGIVLCGEQNFTSEIGLMEGDLVGKPLSTVTTGDSQPALKALLERCRAASAPELASGTLRAELQMLHRYLQPVHVEVTVGAGGTDSQRILVFNCRRTDGRERCQLLVVGAGECGGRLQVRFASPGLAAMLGYPARRLAGGGVGLGQLLPPPFNELHDQWLQDPPHTPHPASCRSGLVVPLLSSCGNQVLVRIRLRNGNTADATMSSSVNHVMEVEMVAPGEDVEERRLVLTAHFNGKVVGVSRPDSDLFGFPARALRGTFLSDCVDVFEEWRVRGGGEVQLLLLALLDRELEMPGASWRVRLREPAGSEALGAGVAVGRSGRPLVSREASDAGAMGAGRAHHNPWHAACLQVELVDEAAKVGAAADDDGDDGGDGSPARVRVVLWRCDLLSGVLELDEHLTVRRAAPETGIIFGQPATALRRKPLSKFLDIPHGPGLTWASLVTELSHHRPRQRRQQRRAALKTSAAEPRGTVAPPLLLAGPHPDGGSLRLVLQGVQSQGPGGRPKIVALVHPSNHPGGRADIGKALHLRISPATAPHAATAKAAAVEGGGVAPAPAQSSKLRSDAEYGEAASARGATTGTATNAGGGGDSPAVSFSDGSRSHGSPKRSAAVSTDPDGDGDDADGGRSDGGDGPGPADAADQDDAAHAVARLHRQATSRSDFVAKWVRAVIAQRAAASGGLGLGPSAVDGVSEPAGPAGRDSPGSHSMGRQRSGGLGADRLLVRGMTSGSVGDGGGVAASELWRGAAGPGRSAAAARSVSVVERGAAGAGLVAGVATLVGAGPEMEMEMVSAAAARVGRSLTALTSMGGTRPVSSLSAVCFSTALAKTDLSEDGGGRGGRITRVSDGGSGYEAEADGGGGGGGGTWEKDSEAGESGVVDNEAVSGVTTITDDSSAIDLAIDARRHRLHKALDKVMLGPSLALPLSRLQYVSYGLMVAMLVAQVVCFVVVKKLIEDQHTNVYEVHHAAMALDKSQLIMWRVMMGPYCERKNITDKSSACGNTISYTLGKLRENIEAMESYHQGVYLGVGRLARLETRVYDIWTSHNLLYNIYLDSKPPQVVGARAGVWQLGNRFLAAARETLYWLPKLKDMYMLHRTCKFIVDAGMVPLFRGYALALDLLMSSAWGSVQRLRTDLIYLMVVEAFGVHLLCSVVQWALVARAERARVVGLVAMVGLPTHLLRQLASREIKVLGDDDDMSSGSGEDDRGEGGKRNHRDQQQQQNRREENGRGGGGGGGEGTGSGGLNAQGDGVSWNRNADVGTGTAEAQLQPLRPQMQCFVVDSPSAAGGGGRLQASFDEGALATAARRQSPTGPRKEEVAAAGPEIGAGTSAAAAPGAMQGPRRGRQTRSCNGSGGAERRRGGGGGGGRLACLGVALMGGSTRINGKLLLPSNANLVWLVGPFLLLNAAVLAVYAVSLWLLADMQGPLACLNMATHVAYRYTHMRCTAWGLVAADDRGSKAAWRELLRQQVGLFEDEYNVLMYGGVAMSQHDSSFQEAVPASTFQSVDFARTFFRERRCFRWDQSLCLPPGHKYYEVTHHGLDVMVRRVITEMRLLAADVDADAVYNRSRYDYIHLVGGRDCYEGLQSAAELFVDFSIRRYNEVTQLQSVLLGVTCGVLLLYTLVLLRPRLGRIRGDAARQSALLSHVPPELDVRGHVRSTFRRMAKKGKGAGTRGPGVTAPC